MSKKNERIIKAYNFLCGKEKNRKTFSLEELSDATGWKVTTVKTYISKQWVGFIQVAKNNKQRYSCNNLLSLSQDKFIDFNSQKLKYAPQIEKEVDLLLEKARQFSLLAISTYNNPYSSFRTYGYIVNIVIAWTALLHAVFCKRKMDYFYKDKSGAPIVVGGSKKAWELKKCLNNYWLKNEPTKANLLFLIGLRNEIEHRNLPSIEKKVAGHCQASLTNFESVLVSEFGVEKALISDVTLALQISRSHEQKIILKEMQKENKLVYDFMDKFENRLPQDFLACPEYRASYFLAPKISNHKTSSDVSIEFVSPGSNEEAEINRILIKEREKEKFKPAQIVKQMQAEGYTEFSIHKHTDLWKSRNAKTNSAYGVKLKDGQWYWYSDWIDQVRKYCQNKYETV